MPLPRVFPEITLWLIVAEVLAPKRLLARPPPVLPETAELLIVIVLKFWIPPPPPVPAKLPDTAQKLSVRFPEFKIPPPRFAGETVSATWPLEMVKPVMVTVVPELIVKMRKSGVPAAALR